MIEACSYRSKLLCCSLKLDPKQDGRTQIWHLEHKVGANIVVTCPPKLLTHLLNDEIDFSIERSGIETEIPINVMEKLMKVEYFARAYSANGFKKGEYTALLPFKKTLAQHTDAIHEMLTFVMRRKEAL